MPSFLSHIINFVLKIKGVKALLSEAPVNPRLVHCYDVLIMRFNGLNY